MNDLNEYSDAREAMILEIAKSAGAISPRVLEAIRSVPRHEFVPEAQKACAYENRPLPIGEQQTISQPLMVAIMTDMLDVQPDDVVLEVGTGSGYQAVVLAKLARQVYTLERREPLAVTARETLCRLGFANIEVIVADGSQGRPEHAPYDRILVTAGSPAVPEALTGQLAPHGKMVIPVGDFSYQVLTLVEMTPEGPEIRRGVGCVFVPLVGKYAWGQGQ
ncbi:MAG: protein-L-isoaspartate(D-aspartate) O-methyltransferase [Armatimonadota bacterium]|nr:protein-L-isoaspartate(D-aspartate) O-methyltransferase [Armatimonadota bacterium]